MYTAELDGPAVAFRLLFHSASGGQSGPANRSGVPLEHPPYQLQPATGCRES
jgi:hypothetical protein